MLLIGIPALAVAFYFAIVVGTYEKLNKNGIYLKGKAKLLFPLVPLVIFVFHLAWSVKCLTTDPKSSIRILKLVLFDYPIVIGMLIELILEKTAFELSKDERIVNIKKKKSFKKAVRKSKALDFSDMPPHQSKTIVKEYVHSVLSYTAS
ncbi:hypothetical protein ABEV41_01905 [Geobacillus thermodenitrificans]|jgi:hypothetical protein|uniref:hypothetical protein n=1 Tax=Geobacillus thermodenitrificans TaxID=33940 RepID=UPI003D1D85DE